MVTKLKNFSTNSATKIISFVLTVIFITAMILQVQYISYLNINPEVLLVKEYKNSEDFFQSYVYNASSEVTSLITNNGKIPENVKFYYYITDGKKSYSNVKNANKSFFEKYDNAFYACEKGMWSVGKNTNSTPIKRYGLDTRYTTYIAFTDEFMSDKQQEWQNSRIKLIPFVIIMSIEFILTILLITFLICVTGRKSEDKELYLSKIDKVYSDILFLFFISSIAIWVAFVSDVYYVNGNVSDNIININQVYSMIGVGIMTIIVSIICGSILLSIVRKIKAGKLLKHSFIYVFFYKIHNFIKSIFDGRMFADYPLTKSLFYRQLVFIGTSAVLVFFTLVLFLLGSPLFLVFPVLEIIIIYWYIKGNNKTFEDINKGFNASLEEQMKAERMKIDLVTNVSHDLKTPLTSIISYVDLLSKEDNLSDTASDYVKILADKSNRLKNIVSDLFDLAKSTSGNITLDLETIDIKKLIEQTLGDMEDEIEKSGLKVKTKLPGNPVNIISDGKRLYRVFQNVIDNALKYSLDGTRIFIELETTDKKVIATIKNTSRYEMDFTADEILQRFNRGDKSRTNDGSGLGLSIAESFTNACGGNFKVDIDGDLFKVTIIFNLQ